MSFYSTILIWSPYLTLYIHTYIYIYTHTHTHTHTHIHCCCCSVTQSCPTLGNPVDRNAPGLSVPHYLPKFAKFISIKSVMPSSHLILWHPLLLLLSIFPSIRDFSNELAVSISCSHIYVCIYINIEGFPCGSSGKETTCHARHRRDMGWIPGSGRPPAGGHSNPLAWRILCTRSLVVYSP